MATRQKSGPAIDDKAVAFHVFGSGELIRHGMHMFGISVSTVSTVRRPVNIDDLYVRMENRFRKYRKARKRGRKNGVFSNFWMRSTPA